MNDTERLYLQAANDLADPMGGFSEEEVGKRIGLDPAQEDLRDDLIRTTNYLSEQGYVEKGDKGGGPGFRNRRITAMRIDEARGY